jgi:hypothetical protein
MKRGRPQEVKVARQSMDRRLGNLGHDGLEARLISHNMVAA